MNSVYYNYSKDKRYIQQDLDMRTYKLYNIIYYKNYILKTVIYRVTLKNQKRNITKYIFGGINYD